MENKTHFQIIQKSLIELQNEVKLLKKDLEQLRFTELAEKIELFLNKSHEIPHPYKEEVHSQVINDPKIHVPNQPANSRQSDYRRLQNMLQSSRHIEPYSYSQKNNNYIPRQMTPLNKNRKPLKSISNGYDPSAQNSKAKKTFRHSQYDLNKNIITSTSSTRKSKKDR